MLENYRQLITLVDKLCLLNICMTNLVDKLYARRDSLRNFSVVFFFCNCHHSFFFRLSFPPFFLLFFCLLSILQPMTWVSFSSRFLRLYLLVASLFLFFLFPLSLSLSPILRLDFFRRNASFLHF